ncbi:VapC toxin [Oleiphilus messinensis]|uniref:VapC toxin n=1 Tax=Oleiphilus messinensis TaxID=141451 RepID=A0A1Y0I8C7_9GAMM|nr:type II toxin-antitoxin system VapC family toxin [Oleiphilus messinensis]ARU56490.1 VapC toxin [Oleiphilus messinensis]
MIVIDTHILLWWLNDDNQLSAAANSAIQTEVNTSGDILVSSISAWEIAMLVEKARLTLSMDVDSWITLAAQVEPVKFVPIDNKVAIESTRLPGEFHKDPADRMITALARTLSAKLVTADEKIRGYKHVKTIW